MTRLALLAALALAPVAPAAEKKPSLPPGDTLGFTMKGQPFALERMFPGVAAALLLTDEQKTKLHAARAETVDSEAVRAAGRKLKEGGGTDADRKAITDARAKLESLVADILTADQKALVGKIEDAATSAREAALEKLQADFTAAKGDAEAMAKVQTELKKESRAAFDLKVAGFLSADQKAAYEKAAAAQEAAEKEAKDKPKVK